MELDPGERARRFMRRLHLEVSKRAYPSTISLWRPAARPSGRMTLAGSGTLLAIADERFIITASHVSAEAREDDRPVGIPLPPDFGSPGWHSLSQWDALETDVEGADVAIVRLLPKDIAALQRGYRFVRLTDIDVADSFKPRSYYAVSGYPHKQQDQTVDPCRLQAVAYMTFPYPADPTAIQGFDPRGHVALPYTASLHSMTQPDGTDGLAGPPPHPGGMSGGGIWRAYDQDVPPHSWTPNSIRLVAVVHSYLPKHEVVLGTRIGGVILVIDRHFPHLRSAIRITFP